MFDGVRTAHLASRLSQLVALVAPGSLLVARAHTQYSTKGTVKEPNFALDGGKALLTAGMGYARDGNAATALTSLFGAAKGMFNERQAGELLREQNTSEADVISWSGCKDDQTVGTELSEAKGRRPDGRGQRGSEAAMRREAAPRAAT